MHRRNRFPISLAAALGALIPIGAIAADAPTAGSVAALSVTPVIGAEAVRVSGTAPGAHQLQAILYANFSQDIPTVLLSRHPVTADADGRYNTTLSIAPAYFRGARITVIVQSLSGVPIAQGSITIAAPNVPAPADVLPPDYR